MPRIFDSIGNTFASGRSVQDQIGTALIDGACAQGGAPNAVLIDSTRGGEARTITLT